MAIGLKGEWGAFRNEPALRGRVASSPSTGGMVHHAQSLRLHTGLTSHIWTWAPRTVRVTTNTYSELSGCASSTARSGSHWRQRAASGVIPLHGGASAHRTEASLERLIPVPSEEQADLKRKCLKNSLWVSPSLGGCTFLKGSFQQIRLNSRGPWGLASLSQFCGSESQWGRSFQQR